MIMMSRLKYFNNGNAIPRGGQITQQHARMSHGISYHPIYGYGLYGGMHTTNYDELLENIEDIPDIEESEYNHTSVAQMIADNKAAAREDPGRAAIYNAEVRTLELMNRGFTGHMRRNAMMANFIDDEDVDEKQYDIISDKVSSIANRAYVDMATNPNKTYNELLELEYAANGPLGYPETDDTQQTDYDSFIEDNITHDMEVYTSGSSHKFFQTLGTAMRIFRETVAKIGPVKDKYGDDVYANGEGLIWEAFIMGNDELYKKMGLTNKIVHREELSPIEAIESDKQFITNGEPVTIEPLTEVPIMNIEDPTTKQFFPYDCGLVSNDTGELTKIVELKFWKKDNILDFIVDVMVEDKRLQDSDFTEAEQRDNFIGVTKTKIDGSESLYVPLWKDIDGINKICAIVSYDKDDPDMIIDIVMPYNHTGYELEFIYKLSGGTTAKLNISKLSTFEYIDNVNYNFQGKKGTRTTDDFDGFDELSGQGLKFGSLTNTIGRAGESKGYMVNPLNLIFK